MGLALAPAVVALAAGVAHAAGLAPVAAVESIVGPICHHDPARTLVFAGELLPVCARCTGVYVGAAGGGVAGLVVPLRQIRVWAAAAALLTIGGGACAVAEAVGLLATPNGLRAALGAALGAGVPAVCALGGRVMRRALL